MYARNNDNAIDRNELLEVIKMMVGENINDDRISDIVDQTIQQLVIETKDN